MTTLRQLEANRRNAQKSTGPRTENGKERSRANRYTHGLAGEGAVREGDEAEMITERLAAWAVGYDPRTQEDCWLIEQMVLETVRIERCQQYERALLYRQVVRAEESWDDDRTLDAARLASRLPKHPTLTSIQLQRTTQGCTLLIDRWTGLLNALQPGQAWDDPLRTLAMDLLGVVPALRDGCTRLDPNPDDGQDIVVHQAELASREIARLTRKQSDYLDDQDAHEREMAASGYAMPDRDIYLIRRYEAACHRRLDRAMRKLEPIRKPAAFAGETDRPELIVEPTDIQPEQVAPGTEPAEAASRQAHEVESPSLEHDDLDVVPLAVTSVPVAHPAVGLSPSPKPHRHLNRKQRRAQQVRERRAAV